MIRARAWTLKNLDNGLTAGLFANPDNYEPDVDIKADGYIVGEGVLEITQQTPTGLSGQFKRRKLALPLSTLAVYLLEDL